MSPETKAGKFQRVNQKDCDYGQYQDHLSAVAQEALISINGEFVHTSLIGVASAIRDAMRFGGDNRFLLGYGLRTLANHIPRAGSELINSFATIDRTSKESNIVFAHIPVSELVKAEKFGEIVQSNGWRETITNLSKTLPSGTTATDISFLLIYAGDFGKIKSVEERLNATREKLKS